MTERISTAYTKEHCTCYDVYNANEEIIAVKLVPDNGYELIHDGYAVSGFALININAIDDFVGYIPQTSAEDDELTAEEALAIITGGGADET